MSEDAIEQVASTIVQTYLDDGNALMGATTFVDFSDRDIDITIDDEEIPSSELAAGSKTYLSGALFGAGITLAALDLADSHEDLDADDRVERNEEQLHESLRNGLDNARLSALKQLMEEDSDDSASDTKVFEG